MECGAVGWVLGERGRSWARSARWLLQEEGYQGAAMVAGLQVFVQNRPGGRLGWRTVIT